MTFSKTFLQLLTSRSMSHRLTAFQIDYIKTRYLALVDHTESRRSRYLFINKLITYCILLGTVVISACLSLERLDFSETPKAVLFWIPWCLSFVVMFLTRVSDTGLNKRYIAIEFFLEKMKSEGFLFLAQSGPYDRSGRAVGNALNGIVSAQSPASQLSPASNASSPNYSDFQLFSERIETIRLKFIDVFGDIQDGGGNSNSSDASEILSLAPHPEDSQETSV